MSLSMLISLVPEVPSDSLVKTLAKRRVDTALELMNNHLGNNKWLAGDTFTMADVMSVYSCTTQRYWGPSVSLKEYENILRWLKDCAARPAYQRAREKGDPDMKDLIGADSPEVSLLATNGVQSDHWKK